MARRNRACPATMFRRHGGLRGVRPLAARGQRAFRGGGPCPGVHDQPCPCSRHSAPPGRRFPHDAASRTSLRPLLQPRVRSQRDTLGRAFQVLPGSGFRVPVVLLSLHRNEPGTNGYSGSGLAFCLAQTPVGVSEQITRPDSITRRVRLCPDSPARTLGVGLES